MVRTLVLFIALMVVLWVMIHPVRAQSINGWTCADVRKLTLLERKYLIWRLGLSQEQVAQIRKVCHIK